MKSSALAGLHTSTWGMYKDAPHEGFTWPKYFRSTLVGATLSAPSEVHVDSSEASPS